MNARPASTTGNKEATSSDCSAHLRRRATRRDDVDSLNVGIRRISHRVCGEGIRPSSRPRRDASANRSASASIAFASTRVPRAPRAGRRDARACDARRLIQARDGPAKTRDFGRSSASARAKARTEVLKIDSRRCDGVFFTLRRFNTNRGTTSPRSSARSGSSGNRDAGTRPIPHTLLLRAESLHTVVGDGIACVNNGSTISRDAISQRNRARVGVASRVAQRRSSRSNMHLVRTRMASPRRAVLPHSRRIPT